MERGAATKTPGRGAPVALVIFILLSAGLGAYSYLLYKNLEDTRTEAINVIKEKEALRDELNQAKIRYDNLFIDLLGYKDEDEIRNIVSGLPGEKNLKNLVAKQTEQINAIQDQLENTKLKYDEQIKSLNASIEEQKKQAADAKKKIDELAKKLSDLETAKKTEVDALNAKIQTLEAAKKKAEADLAASKTAATAALNEAVKKKEAELGATIQSLQAKVKSLQDAIAKKDGEIAALRRRIQVGTVPKRLAVAPKKETPPSQPSAVGDEDIYGVISSDVARVEETAYAEIDIGKAKVQRGDQLDVYPGDGADILKGRVEVINAYDEVSYVKIIVEDSRNPIRRGDIVIYEKRKKVSEAKEKQ